MKGVFFKTVFFFGPAQQATKAIGCAGCCWCCCVCSAYSTNAAVIVVALANAVTRLVQRCWPLNAASWCIVASCCRSLLLDVASLTLLSIEIVVPVVASFLRGIWLSFLWTIVAWICCLHYNYITITVFIDSFSITLCDFVWCVFMLSAGVVFLVAFLVIAQHIYIYVLLSCVVGYYHSTATVTVTGTISKFKSFESSRQRQPDCCVGFPVRHALYNRMCSYVYQNNDARRSTDRRSDTGNLQLKDGFR